MGAKGLGNAQLSRYHNATLEFPPHSTALDKPSMTTTAPRSPLFIASLLAALCMSAAPRSSAADDALAGQRALFVQTRELLQKRMPQAQADAAQNMAALKNYPLYPHLQSRQLGTAISRGASDAETLAQIDEFLAQQSGTVAGEQLRGQWLDALAANERWRQYLHYYRAASTNKQQQCWFIEALHRTGQRDRSLQEIDKLWLTTDMPDTCDDAFKRWLDSDRRSDALIWQRLLLALEHKQETLARFLAVRIGAAYKAQADYALLLYRDPGAVNNLLPQIVQQPEASATLALALKSLARRDPGTAQTLWLQAIAAGHLTNADSSAVRKELGRQQIVVNDVDALPWLLQYDANGEDSYLLEWRVRLALHSGDWSNVEKWIALMPPEMAQTPRWSYWRARALAQSGDETKQKQAGDIFSKLAQERSYYGFLAADWQQTVYQLNDEPIVAAASTDIVAQRPAVMRAREFYLLNEYADARREWQSALRDMTSGEQRMAALIAERWGWYDQGIRSAAASGGFNDLRLRFPIGYRDAMQLAAKTTELPLQWLFAITRQESAFMPDARSSVGALGLMQLMPATAKQVARGERIRIDNNELLQPAVNIRLGSIYLRDMARRYNGNRVLATAAYNAGPGRIGSLLRAQSTTMSTDVWIELLPYRETREYVQSVLAFAVIYSQRLGQPAPLLNTSEREIPVQTLSLRERESNQ